MSDTKDPVVSINISELSACLAKTQESELIEEFLYSILTPGEADEIAKRWALVKSLAEGESQRSIAAELGLSLCKITRGSRELKKADSAFRRMLQIAGYPVSEKMNK